MSTIQKILNEINENKQKDLLKNYFHPIMNYMFGMDDVYITDCFLKNIILKLDSTDIKNFDCICHMQKNNHTILYLIKIDNYIFFKNISKDNGETKIFYDGYFDLNFIGKPFSALECYEYTMMDTEIYDIDDDPEELVNEIQDIIDRKLTLKDLLY